MLIICHAHISLCLLYLGFNQFLKSVDFFCFCFIFSMFGNFVAIISSNSFSIHSHLSFGNNPMMEMSSLLLFYRFLRLFAFSVYFLSVYQAGKILFVGPHLSVDSILWKLHSTIKPIQSVFNFSYCILWTNILPSSTPQIHMMKPQSWMWLYLVIVFL